MPEELPVRYRIDKSGGLFQRVNPGPRTPHAGERCLGEVVGLARGQAPGSAVVTYRAGTPDDTPRQVVVNLGNIVDERLTPPGPPLLHPRRTIAGGAGPDLVEARIVWREGVLAQLELPDGRRFFAVVCTSCNALLSTQSLGAVFQGPRGPITNILAPVACPKCTAPLLEVPSLLAVPSGARAVPKQ